MARKKVKKLVRIRTPFSVQFITTGSDVLDCALGGGWAVGRIANLVGDRSTGKTLIAIETAAAALKRKGVAQQFGKKRVKVVYILAEGSVDFDLWKMYRLNRGAINWEYSDTVEDFDICVTKELETLDDDTLLIIIIDSLDSLTSEGEKKFDAKRQKALEKAAKEEPDDKKGGKKKKQKGSYGVDKAALMNRFFRRNALNIAKKGVLLLIISQTRSNIGVKFGPTKKRSCTDALDFYEAQECWLSETQKEEKKVGKKKRVSSIRIRARVKKLKVGLPYREADMSVLLNYGVDNVGSNVDFLYDLVDGWGRLKKDIGKTLRWEGKLYTRQSLIDHIVVLPPLRKKLTRKVKWLWQEIEEAADHGRPPKYSE